MRCTCLDGVFVLCAKNRREAYGVCTIAERASVLNVSEIGRAYGNAFVSQLAAREQDRTRARLYSQAAAKAVRRKRRATKVSKFFCEI